jgi:hypothetical protein
MEGESVDENQKRTSLHPKADKNVKPRKTLTP